MPQLKKSYTENTIPFSKMTFAPDVPSSALGQNEYNQGENVETDVRGIRSVSGEEEILQSVPGIPTYITGGFRTTGTGGAEEFWFIVATTTGFWYMNNGTSGWQDITPLAGTGYTHSGYSQSINITEAWNGTVPIFNDTVNPPFFLPDGTSGTKLVLYGNVSKAATITDISNYSGGTRTITFTPAAATAPYVAGDQININVAGSVPGSLTSGAVFNGVYTVVSSTTTTITYTTTNNTAVWSSWFGGVVDYAYVWNYYPNWKNLTAGFIRIYSTPNVGNILVAGNLTATLLDDSTARFPVTVRWSQAFGLNQAPLTWMPTILNVANEVEIPLRGEVLDAYPSNGQLFLGSYWDTAVLTPMNYTTTQAPILGIRLFNQGRGLITANCWANTDDMVYGIDARDIWVFDGRTFKGIGNQRIKNWFFDQIDPNYVDRIYVETNTAKNQIEIYYPDHNVAKSGESEGVPNKMISYRHDLDCWNPPRDVSKAAFACESPVWTDTHYYEVLFPTTTTGTGAGLEVTIKRKGTVYTVDKIINPGTGYAIGDTATVPGTSLGGTSPANDCVLTITTIQTGGGVVSATAGGTASFSWVYNKASRGIVYAKGGTGKKLIQKDHGYRFVDNQVINSQFRRDNIRLTPDYSTKTLVHRILPAIVNLKEDNAPIDPAVDTNLIGNVYGTVEGANSVGQAAQTVIAYSIATNTDQPWIQIDQNAHRVNSMELRNDIATPDTVWMANAITFQYTDTEDDR
jgi:hypothetical protein